MKAALMAEQVHFGNDEPSNQLVRLMTGCRSLASSGSLGRQDNMSISAQSIRSFANFKRIGAVRGILALIAVAFTAAMSSPAAAGTRPGAYDGNWNVTFTTRAGNCTSNNSAPFNVSGTQVSSAGGGKVTGGVTPNGAVSVHISVGMSAADGSGRLVGSSGTGRWSGVISDDRCSGTWQASKT
jgi:hypothetical protein